MAKGKKKLNTLLIVGVLGIWGFVIYRFVAGLGGDDDKITFSEHFSVQTKKNTSIDTFSLLLNYENPFLSHPFATMDEKNFGGSSPTQKTILTEKNRKNIKTTTIVKIEPAVTPWPKINYSGMIRNDASKVIVGMFSVDNTSYLVKNGETVSGIKILTIYGDSIKVEFNKERKTLRN